MISFIKKYNPFKRSLSDILSTFNQTVADLRAFADSKTAEVEKKEADIARLTAEVGQDCTAIETALIAADKIEALIDGSV